MVVALIPGLILLVVLGHVAMDLINARSDRQFYEEMVRVRADLRDAE